jgi:hypothetical protein
MLGGLNMVTITMSKQNDMAKLFWCVEVLGEGRFKFAEPMQLTFEKKSDRFLYQIAWGE